MAYEVVMPYHLHMPSYFLETFTEYPYKTARILKETDPKLHQLSIEISTLESLQRETIRKYQRLKYNLKED